MEQILENLELSDEIKSELSESFNQAVLTEALKLAEAKEAEYEDYMFAQLTESKADLEAKLDEYLDRVVEEFVTENELALDESVKSEKYETVLEGFNSLLIAAGVEIAELAEAKEVRSEEVEAEVLEADEVNSEKVDTLMEEVLELKATNAELLKTGLVKESMENMTDVQKDKFMKLATVVEFDAKEPQDFINKLDTIAESVVAAKKEEKVVEKVVEVIVEKVEAKGYVSSARHLY